MTPKHWSLFVLCSCLIASTAFAQNLLPNPGFEDGADLPTSWKLSGGAGAWSAGAHEGKRCLLVEGNGKNSNLWRTENLRLNPGGLYRFSFYARQDPGANGGSAIAGLSRVNRDFRLTDSWQRYSFVFSVPENGTNDYLRLGQWECKGRLYFDDVELLPVQVCGKGGHSLRSMGPLGEAESIENGVYRFQPNFNWIGANYHQTLWHNRASFNSQRWMFSPGAELIYRFATRVPQTNGLISLNINYYISGKLSAEASRDGSSWLPVGSFQGQKHFGFTNLPAILFPSSEIFLRLKLAGAEGNLQLDALRYEASLNQYRGPFQGATYLVDVLQTDPQVKVELRDMGIYEDLRQAQAVFVVTRNDAGLPLKPSVTNCAPCNDPGYRIETGSGRGFLGFCAQLPGAGDHSLYWRISDNSDRTVFLGRSEAKIGFLYDARPGHLLKGNGNIRPWWCESGWKLGPRIAYPHFASNEAPAAVSISAAKGEYEAAQLYLSAKTASETLTSLKTGPFKNSQGETASISLRVDQVEFVHVTRPTDATGERGWYPDPLPPLKLPLTFTRENRTLWLTFQVPREIKAGNYTSELTLELSSGKMRVPLSVHVYDFELPRETHLRSALGLGTHEINRYHNLKTPEDKQAVYEKYLQNFAEHRISPYSFFDYAPIDIRFTGPKTNRQAKVDFTKFDAAATKWLDQFHLNTFLLPLRGMGGGTFQSRSLGELEGFKEGTPEFARIFGDYLGQIERHLNERGWLDKAYTYWFDEPDRKDYQFVVDGMNRIKAAAPGLKRMLTEQPEPELLGHVDIWCGLTPEWTREKVAERRKAGEQVWWYICCGPHAPYITEFIDHPGTELRLWPWQSWQYGVEGILIWATTYWSSSSAFPAPKMQDPWQDPMSYVGGYDFGPGHVGYWGNGDGRFLYPPQRSPATNQPPSLDGPINSIRWENLRDGMEDYEYFWLLQQAITRVNARIFNESSEKASVDKALLDQARALLEIPEEISKDLTHFTTDPRLMLQHRDKVARMIEKLK